MKFLLTLAAILLSTSAIANEPALVETNDPAELKQVIAEQQKKIEQLEAQQLNSDETASGQKQADSQPSKNPLIANKALYMKK